MDSIRQHQIDNEKRTQSQERELQNQEGENRDFFEVKVFQIRIRLDLVCG
jgi:hypothetical protein